MKTEYSETRKEVRHKKHMLVYLKDDYVEFLGLTTNISKNGMFVESAKIFPKNSELIIVLAADSSELFELKSEVIWSRSDDDHSTNSIRSGMGLKILEAPAEYWNYMEYIKYGFTGIL